MKTLCIPEPYILQCDNNSKKKGGDGQRGGRKGEKNRDEERKEHKEDKKIGDKDLSSINQAGLKPSEWLSRDYKPKIKDKKYGQLCWRQNLSIIMATASSWWTARAKPTTSGQRISLFTERSEQS